MSNVVPNMHQRKFSNRKYLLAAFFTSFLVSSSLVLFANVAFSQTAYSATIEIPSSMKIVVGEWASGQINDSDFLQEFQYFINQGLWKAPIIEANSGAAAEPIPVWIKNSAKWWSDGYIEDSDFIGGIQYLFENGYISGQFNKSLPQSVTNVTITEGAGTSIQCIKTSSCFNPDEISVETGNKVVWTNNDRVAHQLTSGEPTDDKRGTVFENKIIPSGGNFSFTFNLNGTYNYFCEIHPWITGKAIVSGNNKSYTQTVNNNADTQTVNNSTKSTQPRGAFGMPDLSDSDRQAIIDVALNDPGVKAWSDAWVVSTVDLSGPTYPPEWKYAFVWLYLSPDAPAKLKCDSGWRAKVKVDVNTKEDLLAWYPTSAFDCNR